MWTRACDKRLARLISYVHHTTEFKQHCHVGTLHINVIFFKILILPVTWKIQNQHRVESYAFFGSHTFVPISWMCKKQTSVSHSSTEAEIISLDAGLRMDGIPALHLWNLVFEVFHFSPNQSNKTKDSSAQWTCRIAPRQASAPRIKPKLQPQDSSDLFHVDNVLSNAKFSQSSAILYVFEDNVAVIKMIIKGRSPTMRRVSRTHRLLIGCLTELNWILRFKSG